jgi:DMSO/TMAO reductase YedYZ molybdopterin-dependent catalytic subunit
LTVTTDYAALVEHGIREQRLATTVTEEIAAWERVLAFHLGPPEGPPPTRDQARRYAALLRASGRREEAGGRSTTPRTRGR